MEERVFMAWTSPKSWTAEVLTSSDLNTHLRDNLNALKDPPDSFYDMSVASDISFTTTSFADLDAALSLSITSYGGDLRVYFQAAIVQSAGIAYFSFDLDGTTVNSADDGLARSNGTAAHMLTMEYWFRGVASGAHTIKVKAKVSTGTLTVYRGQASAGNRVDGFYMGREIS